MDTLFFLLNYVFNDALEIQSATKIAYGMGIDVATELPVDAFWHKLTKMITGISAERIVPVAPPNQVDRYDAQVPETLLRKAYAHNILDIDGLKMAMKDA